MKDILITEIYPPEKGGSGKWLKEIYSRMPNRVAVITNTATDSHVDLSPERIYRINLRFSETGFFHPRGFYNYLYRANKIRHLIKSHKPTLIRSARVLPEGWLAWLNKKLFIGPDYHVFAHGEEINLDGRDGGGVMSSRQHRIMAKIVFRGASKIIANSKSTASILKSQWHLPSEKIVIANPGVDASFFVPLDINLDIARTKSAQLNHWKKKFVLLTVGRLQKRKGHDQVLRTIPKLIKKIPNLLYVIAGNGEELDNLRDIANKLAIESHIEFIQHSDDLLLKSCYQLCDLFILANRQIGSDIEGFGIVLLEAAACGKPTIAGASGGTREAIDHPETGLLIDAESQEEIALAITTLYSSAELRKHMGLAGRKRVLEKFDWPVVTAQIPIE